MNKTFYILGIVFSVVFFIVIAYYIDEVNSARYADLSNALNSYDPYGYSSYYSYSDSSSDITSEAGIVSALFILFFIAADILGLLKIKTRTIKVVGIIGLSLSGLFLLWAIVMLGSPGAISFDEAGAGFWLYALIMLAFSITGLIQSIVFSKRKSGGGNTSNDLLDS
jgi:hypothetical protein